MGEHFASLEIAKELERQIYNKPHTHWLVVEQNGRAVGFVSVFETMTSYFIDNLYVVPAFRNKGYASGLIRNVCDKYSSKPLKCIACNPYALKVFENFGFAEVGQRGKYKKLVKH
jgi:GNAT superfamily N-acetyltransferase